MKRILVIGTALWFTGCGLENFFSNETHSDFARMSP